LTSFNTSALNQQCYHLRHVTPLLYSTLPAGPTWVRPRKEPLAINLTYIKTQKSWSELFYTHSHTHSYKNWTFRKFTDTSKTPREGLRKATQKSCLDKYLNQNRWQQH